MSNSRRKLPIWLMNLKTDENEGTMIERKPLETKTGVSGPTRRVLRSNSNSDRNPFDETNPAPRRSVRNTSSISEPKLKPAEYPFIEYKGSIKYLTDFHDIAAECDELLTWVENHEKDVVPIAFDMEWPFSFKTGSGKSAVIQICADINLCYVFHIFALKKLPAVLLALLSHDKTRLHGVNIKNDFRKLERDFPEAKVQKMVDQCVDLGVWCNEVQNTGGRWSMERLVSYICKLRIDKNRKVRMSQWHVAPLDENQKMYAAIDVYISQVIYYELEKRKIEKDIKAAKILEEYGQDSYNALKVLGRI